jgi:hypothetical protein
MNMIAFLGSGINEAPSVHLGSGGSSQKIATKAVERFIHKYSEDELEDVIVESRYVDEHHFLYVHLPFETLVYDATASTVANEPIWMVITNDSMSYPSRFPTYVYDTWVTAHPSESRLGELKEDSIYFWDAENLPEYSCVTPLVFSTGSSIVEMNLYTMGMCDSTPNLAVQWSDDDGYTWSRKVLTNSRSGAEQNLSKNWRRMGRVAERRCLKFTWSGVQLRPVTLNLTLDM